MLNRSAILLVLWLLLLIVTSCKESVNVEIEKWKQELLTNKQIGSSCDFEKLEPSALQEWRENNPDQFNRLLADEGMNLDDFSNLNPDEKEAILLYFLGKEWKENNPNQFDGLPTNEEINVVSSNFDQDNQEDILLYFQSKNCTGHNGNTKTFAKVIYADGTSNSDLMNEIIDALLSTYNQKRETDKNLKEITRNYLEESISIDGYHHGIIGTFILYTKEDPHCCPSYRGNYTYTIHSKHIDIEILERN